MSNFFISYSHDGKEGSRLAEWLHDQLTRQGHDAFVYKKSVAAGQRWGEIIGRLLNECDLFTVLLCETSARSDAVAEEVRRAHSRNRNGGQPVIITVRVSFDGDPGYHLSFMLEPYQRVEWNDEEDSEAVLVQLLQAAGLSSEEAVVMKASKRKSKSRSKRERGLKPPLPMASPVPGGAMERDDPFYIERPIEATLKDLSASSGSTVTIEAPRQLGKSSMLQRYLTACETAGQRTALVDLSMFDEPDLRHYDRMLARIAQRIARELNVKTEIPDEIGGSSKFTYWIEDHIFPAVAEPIALAFDETDIVFDYPHRLHFFQMLRSWQNLRAKSREWRRLGLAMVISTERNLLIDDARTSPFNIGLHAALQPFSIEECLELNRRFDALSGRALAADDVKRLYELLGGQPFLTHLAIFSVVTTRLWSVESLIEKACEEESPFYDHLRALESRISRRAEWGLDDALRQIIAGKSKADKRTIGRLKAAGLVRTENGKPVPANQLYARFFGQEL